MKISVAICTYNGSKYLAKQLDSILQQDHYLPDEIVVCDDISNDATNEILRHYEQLYPSIFKVFINETNLGSNKNFEKAITLCTGDFLFLSDQDDVWKKDKIVKTMRVFEQNSTAEAVFSNADLIDGADNLIANKTIWNSVFFLENELPKPIDFFDLIAKNGNVITGATLCMKKDVKAFIFPFPTTIFHDEWIAQLLALRNTIAYSTEFLISYRIHENQQVGMKNKDKLNKINRKKRIILGLLPPKTYNDYRLLLKKSYSKIKTLHFLKEQKISLPQLETTLIKSVSDYLQLQQTMKSTYFFKTLVSQSVDAFLGKRKL